MSVEVVENGKVFVIATGDKTPRQARELAAELLLAAQEAEQSNRRA